MKSVFAMTMLLLAGCAASPGPLPVWTPLGSQSARVADVFGLTAMSRNYPNSASVQRRLLGAAHAAENHESLRRTVGRLADMGSGLSRGAREAVSRSFEPAEMSAMESRFDANVRPLGASRVVAVVPAEVDLVEGLAWDAGRERLFVTSVVDAALWALEKGVWSRQELPGATGSLYGAVVDPVRGHLWLTSTATHAGARANSFVGLIRLELKDAASPLLIPAPEGVDPTPGDILVGPDGTAYASDGLNGAVYRCRPGCDRLSLLLPPGIFRSSQGLALSPDGTKLYVADWSYGLGYVDLASGQAHAVAAPPDMMLDGIDGLLMHQVGLIAIQKSGSPQRIIRLRLSRDGRRVEALEVLERANPEWGELTLAAITGDRLLYIADAQWESYGDGGALKAGSTPRPTPIRELRLR